MRHINRWLRGAVLLWVALSAMGPSAQAEWTLTKLGVGLVMPTPLGDFYHIFDKGTGVAGELWLDETGFAGKAFDWHVSFAYQPYSVRGVSNITMGQWTVMAGLATREDTTRWLRPFFGAELGTVYSRLFYSSEQVGVIQNSSLWLAAQFRPGFSFPLMDNLSATVAVPIMFVFSGSKFSVLNSTVSLRWAL